MATVPPFDLFSCSPFEESVKEAQIWSRRGGDPVTSSPGMAEYDKLVDHWTEDSVRTVTQGLASGGTAPADLDQDLYTSAMRSLNLNRPPLQQEDDVSARYLRLQQQWNVRRFDRDMDDPVPGNNYNSGIRNHSQANQRQPHYARPLLMPHGHESENRYRQPVNSGDPLIDLSSPPLRQIRGCAVNQPPIDLSYDLSYQLDRCQEQVKLMERERRKGEQGLSQLFPGKKISGNNSIPVPKLPLKPTRVDRLIVDQVKEHAKIFTLISLMEQLSGNLANEMLSKIQAWLEALRALQTARQEETVAAAGGPDSNASLVRREASGPAVSFAVKQLCAATRTARTTFWSAFITVVNRESANRQPAHREAGSEEAVAEAVTPHGEPVIPVSLRPAPLSSPHSL